MTTFVALLRAVNVGGTGNLPMSELRSMCEDAGFQSVSTYIASGNIIFKSNKKQHQVKAKLEAALAAYAGKQVIVFVRTASEMAAILAQNPFSKMPASRTVAFFLDDPPASDALESVSHRANEQLRLGHCEIYVYYPEGLGHSKLKIPAAKNGTARNMNTVAKLASLAADLHS